jgi:prolipoprotein diacylglyceryltransferase
VQFPLYLGPLHPHPLFEALGYAAAGGLYRQIRASRPDHLDDVARGWVLVAAVLGGALGAKLLYWLSDPVHALADPAVAMGGKSVVGGLIGALVAVEWTTRRLGVTRATGDLFVFPLLLGIAIGRIGCFLTGLDDHTHGLPTALPWGVDFGDGPRHPTQLYEVAFLLLLGALLAGWRRPGEGDLFKAFMVAYLGFRLALEAIKPGIPILGLNAIQWVCLAGLAYYGGLLLARARAGTSTGAALRGPPPAHPAGET